MSYIKNTWYVAAWAEDVSQSQLLGRQILGEHLVLFRDADNRPAALVDRCSHRFAALSQGKIIDGNVQCPYHGLRFSGAGECVFNPHGDGRIPRRSGVRSYPVVERQNAVWIWMGDPEAADADKIPVFEFMNPDDNYIGTGGMKVAANYQLESDNILDLSHIEFLHPMFSSPAVSKAKLSHEIDGETVWSRRDILEDESPPDFIRSGFKVPEGPIDRWLHVHWQAPAYMALYAGGVASGKPREQGVISRQAHWFTPETETSTHYFFATTRPKSEGKEAEAAAKAHVKALHGPFSAEDAPIIEAQQRNVGEREFSELRPLILNIDAAGAAARRIVAKKLKAEMERSG